MLAYLCHLSGSQSSMLAMSATRAEGGLLAASGECSCPVIPFPLSHTGNPLLLFKLWPWGPPYVPGAFQDSSSGTHLKCLQRSMPTSCVQPVVRRLFSLLTCWRGTRALDWDISVPRLKAWRLLQTLYHFSLAFDLSLPIYQEQSSQTARVP